MGSLYNRISVLIGRDVSVLSVSLPREGTGRRQSSPTQEAGSRQAPWSSSWTSGLQDCEIVRFWFLSYSLHLCCTSCPESAILCLVRLVTQSCLTLCNPVDCSPPGSSVHGILQARILEWVAMPSSRGSFQPRSPVLQADSSLSEPPGKPKNTGVGSYPLSRGSSRPRNWTRFFYTAGRFFQLSGMLQQLKADQYTQRRHVITQMEGRSWSPVFLLGACYRFVSPPTKDIQVPTPSLCEWDLFGNKVFCM